MLRSTNQSGTFVSFDKIEMRFLSDIPFDVLQGEDLHMIDIDISLVFSKVFEQVAHRI